MITARNYAAQVKRKADKVCAQFKSTGHPGYKQMEGMALGIPIAQHFAIPDGGKIFDSDLKGLVGLEPRLPYPEITIEFCDQKDKLFIFAYEIEVNGKFEIRAMGACDLGDGWEFIPFIAASSGEVKENGRFFASIRDAKGWRNDAEYEEIAASSFILRSVYELCEALSCTNVSHEPIEKINPAVNARRVRDGKLPLYETHRLVINAGKQSSISGVSGSSHASPRQHLRRGHIRRLPSGNIWVNSCVVGSAELGVVKKEYAIRRAA
jgi:hypothetical protein